MRLRDRFRASAAISFGAILVLAVGLGLSWHASSRASDAEDLAKVLQQQILERGILRDEYLMYREERARAQWYAKTARLEELLRSAAAAFDGKNERETIGEMAAIVERGKPLFGEIVGHPDAREREEHKPALSSALRERASTRMLLLYYDLYSHANRLAESASRRARLTQKTTLLSVMGMIGAVLAMTIINALMTSGLLERRITRLRDGAERVAAGNLRYRIAIAGNDELAELGQAFDTMAASLQQTHLALEAKAAEVATLNEELKGQVVQLSVANKELDAFSHSVSHDLRAPLRAIDGFSQVLLEDCGERLDETGRDALGRVRAATARMAQLIDDLLRLSRVSRAELRRVNIDLSEVARGVVSELSVGEPGRRVEVHVAEGVTAEGDPELVRLVLENLLGNAFKFTSKRAEARVDFGVERLDGAPVYFVRDNGVGFDMAYANKLFGAFQRLHAGAEFPGTGIGLATVQRVVHRHGGRVWAEGAVDGGATFRFTL